MVWRRDVPLERLHGKTSRRRFTNTTRRSFSPHKTRLDSRAVLSPLNTFEARSLLKEEGARSYLSSKRCAPRFPTSRIRIDYKQIWLQTSRIWIKPSTEVEILLEVCWCGYKQEATTMASSYPRWTPTAIWGPLKPYPVPKSKSGEINVQIAL